MTVDLIYNKLIAKLTKLGYLDIVNHLEKLVAGGSTGGEILALTAEYLVGLKMTNPLIYNEIKSEITMYLKFC